MVCIDGIWYLLFLNSVMRSRIICCAAPDLLNYAAPATKKINNIYKLILKYFCLLLSETYIRCECEVEK
jgi:hypothetical protein